MTILSQFTDVETEALPTRCRGQGWDLGWPVSGTHTLPAASALTAGFRPSFSRVFLLRGPSMVGAAAELPSVQMHGPVGLGRGRTWVRHHPEELGTGTLSPMGPTGPRLPGPGPGPQTENSTGLSQAQEGGL